MIDRLLKLMFLTLILSLMGCQAPETPQEPVRPVRTMVVPETSHILTRVFPGKISPAREVNLSFRVSNNIMEVPVKKGQYVDTGDIIASLDPRDFEIALRNTTGKLDEARANMRAMLTGARPQDVLSLESKLESARTALDEAALQYERYTKLHRMGAVATAVLDNARSKNKEARSTVRSLEMELEKALKGAREEDIAAMQARISSLEAGLHEARAALEDSVLRAPFEGFVAEIFVDNHQNVSAGQPVVRLQDISRLEIQTGLPEQLMVQKDMIKSIHVRLETFPEHFFPARIKEIATEAAAMSMTYELTSILDRPWTIPVYPSMAADVYIAFRPYDDGGYIIVPETAIVSPDGVQNRLWIYDPETKKVNSRTVVPGGMTGQGIQIVRGLEPGEIIVSAGADFLEEGQVVRVINDSAGR